MMRKSEGELLLANDLDELGVPYVAEYRFNPNRRWRADFAYPELGIIIEIEGGVYARGRHTRGVGFTNDCEKYNSAVLMGYYVLRFTTEHVVNGYAINTIRKAIDVVMSRQSIRKN